MLSHELLWPRNGALSAEEHRLIQPVETMLPQSTQPAPRKILQAVAAVENIAVLTASGEMYEYHPPHVMSVESGLDCAALGAANVCPTRAWVLLHSPINPNHQVVCVAVGHNHGVGVIHDGRAIRWGWDSLGQSGGGLGPLGDANGPPVRGMADGPAPLREIWNLEENKSHFFGANCEPRHIVSVSSPDKR